MQRSWCLSLWLVLSFTSVGTALLFLWSGASLSFANDLAGDSLAVAPDLSVSTRPAAPWISDEGYLRFLQSERNNSLYHQDSQPLTVWYRGMAGLGHQLLRLAGLYHLATVYRLPLLWATENPVCFGTIHSIYDHLIGEGQLLVDVSYLGSENVFRRGDLTVPRGWPNLTLANETQMSEVERSSLKRDVFVPNTVAGYTQYFTLPKKAKQELHNNHYWRQDFSDYQLYHQLMVLFKHRHGALIRDVMTNTNFTKHTVFGLHIRTGNGEKGEFQQKHRGIENLEEYLTNITNLLCSYWEKYRAQYFSSKPLMVFVGTDTGSVIAKLQAASQARCGIPFVSAAQSYPEEGRGVSFSQSYEQVDPNEPNKQCLSGWVYQFLDMYMFTECNTVLAGTYSSFSQAAPLSYVMRKSQRARASPQNSGHPHYFCDIGASANRMDCASTLKEWLDEKPTMTWGDGMDKQNRRVELHVPATFRAPTDITRLFENTALLPLTSKGAPQAVFKLKT